MIVWFPLLKLAVSLLLIYLAWLPIEKHIKGYKERERQALAGEIAMTADDTYFPRDKKKWLPLVLVTLLILMSPFKLQSPQQLERTVQSYDASVAPPPMIEREARKKYTPPSNQPLIDEILREEVKQ